MLKANTGKPQLKAKSYKLKAKRDEKRRPSGCQMFRNVSAAPGGGAQADFFLLCNHKNKQPIDVGKEGELVE